MPDDERPIPKGRALQLVVNAVLVALAGYLVAQVVIGVNALQHTSARASEQRDEAISLSRLLVECTTAPQLREPPVLHPGPSDCYVRQQAGASAFASPKGPLAPLLVAAAACGAANPGDVPATTRCTTEALTR